MNAKQRAYIKEHCETKSAKALAEELSLNRKLVQQELRRLSAGKPPQTQPAEAVADVAVENKTAFWHVLVVGILLVLVGALYARSLSFPFLS